MSWVSLMVQSASSDSGSTTWSGFGGHALIAVYQGDADDGIYEVFHLVGARGSSSGGSGHAFYNSYTSIERYRCQDDGTAKSCGGRSGRSSSAESSFPEVIKGYDYTKWYETPANKRLNIRETPRFQISSETAGKIIEKCMALCDTADVSKSVGTFSLIGGQVNLGTNCITWAYGILKSVGVTFDWKLYAMSFVSPRKAVESGGGLQMA